METIEITYDDYQELQRLYDEAVRREHNVFIWQDQEILTSYAKYLLEYLKSRYGR